MEKYTKINTLYKRYQFKTQDLPKKDWVRFKNKIIIGEFSDKAAELLFHSEWECYSKIDGTNCKIAYFPSTCEIRVEGKEEKSNDQQGMFAYLTTIGERIKPILMELYPKETAKFVPVIDKDTKKIIYHNDNDVVEPTQAGMYKVVLEESPVYIYGEYFGKGIQKCGKRYLADSNDFIVFDIKQQGWWTPKDVRDALCEKLGLKQVPFIGNMTLEVAQEIVREGFPTKYDDANDPTLIEEGLVCRPTIPLFNAPNANTRVIVKVKYCDYQELDSVIGDDIEDYEEFKKWYKEYEKNDN